MRSTKKVLVLLLCVVMLLSMAACRQTETPAATDNGTSTETEGTVPSDEGKRNNFV